MTIDELKKHLDQWSGDTIVVIGSGTVGQDNGGEYMDDLNQYPIHQVTQGPDIDGKETCAIMYANE